jgi:hypothetical protein
MKGFRNYSFLAGILFTYLYFWVTAEFQFVSNEWATLSENSDNLEFGIIQESRPKHNKISYLVTDESGRVHEVSEVVDSDLKRKLRVGDTVPVYRKSFSIFGKEEIISKLKWNRLEKIPLQGLSELLFYSSIFFWVAFCISTILGFFKKLNTD